jgi:hypothetical protein
MLPTAIHGIHPCHPLSCDWCPIYLFRVGIYLSDLSDLSIYIQSQSSSTKLTFFFEMLPRSSKSLTFWNTRCNPPFVISLHYAFLGFFHLLQIYSPRCTISASGSTASTNFHFVIYKGWRTKWHIRYSHWFCTSVCSIVFMFSSIAYLNQTGIFSTNVWLKNLPQTRICCCYHVHFRPSFLSTRRSLQPNIDPGPIYWNMISSSCLCMGGSWID